MDNFRMEHSSLARISPPLAGYRPLGSSSRVAIAVVGAVLVTTIAAFIAAFSYQSFNAPLLQVAEPAVGDVAEPPVSDDYGWEASKPGQKAVYLWPLPKTYSRGNFVVGVDKDLEFRISGAASGSMALQEGISRIRPLIFSHSQAPSKSLGWSFSAFSRTGQRHTRPTLMELQIQVESADETLQLETSEAYMLEVPGEGGTALLKADTIYGALHGLQTFSQLCTYNFDAKAVHIREAPWKITDSPRFRHRGILIDTSRHFEPIPLLKRLIDSMSYAKMNVLHWHIVDEQSFPLEVPSFPGLWRGAYRPEERFTMDDVRDLVEYARFRGIKVMAELDVPGHAASWGVGYPELWPSADCKTPLDVTKNLTFEVIDGILQDFAEVFPYRLLHLGGDEVDTSCWFNSPHINQWMADRQLDARGAYAYFVRKAQELGLARGWDPVNWQEPFEHFPDKLHKRTIVHEWYGPGICPRAVAAGFRCLVSNQDAWYLDHIDIPWEKFYKNEPYADIADSKYYKLIVGGEVCMWGETVDPSNVLQTIWPRAAAAAERLWSTQGAVDKADMEVVLARMEWFRCLMHRRSIPSAPVLNGMARSAPGNPGSCYYQ